MKNRFLYFAVIFLLAMFVSCEKEPENVRTSSNGYVTFFNESSYIVEVHATAFSGPVITTLASGESKKCEIPESDNHGVGTTFSIGYKTRVFSEPDLSCGDVYAYGIDPDMQITVNIEAEKNHFLRISQPSNLVFESAFLRVINSSENYFELKKNSMSFKQTGNGNLTVDAGKIGIYEIDSSSVGKKFQGYELRSAFKSIDFPEFDAEYNHTYTYIFDGTSVTKDSEQVLSY